MKAIDLSKLRTKVALLLTLLFVVLLGQATLKAVLNFDTIKQQKLHELEWAAKWIESEQHRHMAQARMVALIATNEIRKGMSEQVCRQGVVGKPGLDAEFGRFAIADLSGNLSCNSIPWLSNANIASQPYFQKGLGLTDRSFVDEIDNRNPNEYAGILVRAVRDRDGKVLSLILMALDFSWLKEEVIPLELSDAGHLLVTDEAGILIAGSKNTESLTDHSLADSPLYKLIATSTDSAFEGAGFNGERSFIVSHQFKTGSGLMRVTLDIPRSTLLLPAYRSLSITIAISTLILLLLIWLAFEWTDKYVLRKLNTIEQAARKVKDGELSTRINLSGKGEIAQLAHAFDNMTESLQTKQLALIEADNEIHRVNRALRVLSAGNRSLLFASTEQELLARICHDIVQEGDYIAAWIGFTGAEQDIYLQTAASHYRNGGTAEKSAYDLSYAGLKTVYSAVKGDRIVVINDTHPEQTSPELTEHAAKIGYRSTIILPLHLNAQPLGALILSAESEQEFGGLQIKYLTETAADTSFGIEMLRSKGENSRLALLGVHHDSMLKESLEEALRAISLTIEMRDPYTSGHQRRVADLAKALAIELGLSADEVHGIYLASIVHDIGKINVPAEILVKPGKLKPTEYELVKYHVEASYEILKGIRFPWPIAVMVHQHHERLDGSGYPLGLSDGNILFGSRIMAVADVVEAMSSHRPYRPGLGIEAALQEIERGRGTIYDAAVVDACLKLFHEKLYSLV